MARQDKRWQTKDTDKTRHRKDKTQKKQNTEKTRQIRDNEKERGKTKKRHRHRFQSWRVGRVATPEFREWVLYCIVSTRLYSASYSANQTKALPVREIQREDSSLERTKRGTWVSWGSRSLHKIIIIIISCVMYRNMR